MTAIQSYKELRTPCFIFDKEEFFLSIESFQQALSKNFKETIIGYSVKTNSTPSCLKLAKEKGIYAEVVSHDEYQLALLCGFHPSKIIYNGPMKSKETFFDALKNEAIVNIETKRELEWLKELPANLHVKVGLRLNMNISHISPEDANGDSDNSRFGFSDETKEFDDAISFINNLPNVTLEGLHIHRTAHSRSVWFYKNSITYACEIIQKYHLRLNYLDIGGGYFGIFPNKPTFQQYSDAFYEILCKYNLQQLRLIVEPGNALVASCFEFISEVIDIKQVDNHSWFITTDGSRNDIDPFFRKISYLNDVFYQNVTPIVTKQTICGCTCLENDRMFTLTNQPLLQVGDRIRYRNVGAYTLCLSPMFIRYIPNIYIKENNSYSLIREKWTALELIQKTTI